MKTQLQHVRTCREVTLTDEEAELANNDVPIYKEVQLISLLTQTDFGCVWAVEEDADEATHAYFSAGQSYQYNRNWMCDFDYLLEKYGVERVENYYTDVIALDIRNLSIGERDAFLRILDALIAYYVNSEAKRRELYQAEQEGQKA